MRIAFRADASRRIGSGHVMRCLTLADQLQQRGARCHFLCRPHPGHLGALIQRRGHGLSLLAAPEDAATTATPQLAHADWLGASQDADARQSRDLLGEPPWDALVVDHYGLDARWESALRPHCRRILVIDDLADRQHDCELLLDQNLRPADSPAYPPLLPAHARCLLGPDYALLRPAFAAAHACARPRRWPPQRLLLFFGGADADNLSGRVLELLTRLHPELAIDALIGPSNPHRPALEARWQGHPGIRLLPPQDEPCPLLLEADLALGATGATTWERAATGLPAIVLALADNQLPIARAAADAGLHTFLGDARRLSDGELAERLGAALADHARLAAQSAAGLALVDGRGAERVADLLLAGLHP